MTFIDLFLCLPLPAKIICGLMLSVWGIEVFLLPFKFNVLYHTQKETKMLIHQLLKVSEVNKVSFADTQKLTSILIDVLNNKQVNKSKLPKEIIDKQQEK